MKIDKSTLLSDINTSGIDSSNSYVYKHTLDFLENKCLRPYMRNIITQQTYEDMLKSARKVLLGIIKRVKMGYTMYKNSIPPLGAVLSEPTLEDILPLKEDTLNVCPCCGKPND